MQPEQRESGAIGRNLGKVLYFGSHVWMCEFIAGHTADATGQSGQILGNKSTFGGLLNPVLIVERMMVHA